MKRNADNLNRMQQKMRSRKGASITFGLLIFLVCAILCSVILVAATTASGRVAGMAEMDQRYYCVTSAAELLRDMIKGKTVVVVREEKFKKASEDDTTATVPVNDTTTIYMGTGSGTAVINDNNICGEIVTTYDDSGEIEGTVITPAKNKINQSFLTDAALRSVETSVTSGVDAYYESGLSSAKRTLTMQVPGKDSLTAIVDEVVNPSVGGLAEPGTMLFTVCNADTTGGTIKKANNRYQMTLTFKADMVSTPKEGIAEDQKTTTTITWSLQSIQ